MVLSRQPEICERESVKKSQWRRVNVLCHVDWLVLLLASGGSENRETGHACPDRKACVEEGERMLPRLFIVAKGSDPGRMAWNILIGRKYEFGTKTVKIFLSQTIIWNSFCYTLQDKNVTLMHANVFCVYKNILITYKHIKNPRLYGNCSIWFRRFSIQNIIVLHSDNHID